LFEFQPLPVSFLLMLSLIVVVYIATADIAKQIFYRHVRF
jgi:Mg2+-importing ATPase